MIRIIAESAGIVALVVVCVLGVWAIGAAVRGAYRWWTK